MMRAGKDYGVRVVTAYENRQVGQVFFPPGVLREHLIRRGLVKAVEPGDEPAADTSSRKTEEASAAKGKKPRGGLFR